MSVAALQLHDVRKSFGRTAIINGVNLSINPGERHAIIGPNGAGKSTLFNLISGRFGVTSGQIDLQLRNFFSFSNFLRKCILPIIRNLAGERNEGFTC